jgi:alpha-beta hydrolase superfamily lysophospholipase
MVQKEESYIGSKNGINKLHVIAWIPDGEKRAILQIAHGMSEYIDRYDRFAQFMAERGILVIGNDHLGHGKSVADDTELGYFNTDRGSATLVDDMYRVTMDVRSHYPDLPFFIMGHSMGSFLARRYMMTYGEGVSGAIFMGTGAQPAAALKLAQLTAEAIGKVKGDRYKSKVLNAMAFGSYNKRIKPVRTEFDWLSVNEVNVDRYIKDPYCGFPFTVNGFKVLFDLIAYIQDPENYKRIPKDVPLFLVSGKQDPVGSYGEAVKEVAKTYREAGVHKIHVKLYAGDRHELLNEKDHDKVDGDILSFIELNMNGRQKA